MNDVLKKIVLGTVQFGLDYGISNHSGKVNPTEVTEILQICHEHGIHILDTAVAYGESEHVVGQAMEAAGLADVFEIVSKLDPTGFPGPLSAITGILERLHKPKLYGLLFHHFDTWREKPWLWDELKQVRKAGLVEKIGFSLYRPSELQEVLDAGVVPQLIQIPYSVFDQRFDIMFHTCELLGIEVHVRSVFLQGLVFLDPDTLPPFFSGINLSLRGLRRFSDMFGISVEHICLGFALSNEKISKVLIGVESSENLLKNLDVTLCMPTICGNKEILKKLLVHDERLVMPMHWPLK